MKKLIHSFAPHGVVDMQPSKSVLHRALICAALAPGQSVIENYASSEDIEATMRVLRDLGLARFAPKGRECTVQGGMHEPSAAALDCGESGTTLRLLFPLMLDGREHEITGRGRLLERPFGPYEELCREQGINLERTTSGIHVCGVLRAGDIAVPGNISSQFISGMLLGFSRVPGESRIRVTSPLESAPYVDLTREVMEAFGAVTKVETDGFFVRGLQDYVACTFAVEGDYSHAAFFAAAGALGGSVRLRGLQRDSQQGDKAMLDILQSAGADVVWGEDEVIISRRDLQPMDVDVSQIPDLVPVLAALACGVKGRSVLRNAARLRMKESDRLSAMREELQKIGARIEEYPDALVIDGTGSLAGGHADAHNDHRVVMALAAAAVIACGPVEIDSAEAVSKSAPRFFEEWKAIGGF